MAEQERHGREQEPPTDVVADQLEPAEVEGGRRPGLTPLSLLLTIVVAYLLYTAQIVVLLLIASIILATAIAGPVDFLQRRWRAPRGLAILAMYLIIIAGLAGIMALLVPPIAREGGRFASEAPELVESWRGQLSGSENPVVRQVAIRVNEFLTSSTATGNLPVSPGLALGVAQDIGGVLVTLFSILLVAFYWLMERDLIRRTAISLFRPEQRARAERLWDKIEVTLGGWMRGQMILMLVVGVIATLVYSPLLMGLPFWLILGVIAGLTEAIPNVGPILGAIPAVLLALTVDWRLALGVVAFVALLQLLENAVLVPRIMRGAVGLSPLTVILAILIGAEYRGIVGALLAIPIAGALQVIIGDMLSEKRTHTRNERPGGGWLRRVLPSRDLRPAPAESAPPPPSGSVQG